MSESVKYGFIMSTPSYAWSISSPDRLRRRYQPAGHDLQQRDRCRSAIGLRGEILREVSLVAALLGRAELIRKTDCAWRTTIRHFDHDVVDPLVPEVILDPGAADPRTFPSMT